MARCASDPVCGGTIRAAGVPSAERNALSGNVAAGTAARAVTARRMSLSSPHRRDVFCAIADSEFAHSYCRVKPGLGSMYFLFHTALWDH